jgi:hypothetical protein
MVMPEWESGIVWKMPARFHIVMELTERCHYLMKSYVVGGAARVMCQLDDTRRVDGKAAMQPENVIARFSHTTPEKSTQARQPDARPGNG